jgi:YggT family protein
MLIRIVSFLLESLFFVLIAAALLRAWMNWLRINMRTQPGLFVMAITDWLVKPLRRVIPAALAQSKVDWASVVAAFVLALAYGLLWTVLISVMVGSAGMLSDVVPGALLGIGGFAAKMLIRVVLQGLFFMVLAFAVLSWVQPGSPAYHQLGRLIDPFITPIRRVVPSIGGVDLSALVLMLILQLGLMLLG